MAVLLLGGAPVTLSGGIGVPGGGGGPALNPPLPLNRDIANTGHSITDGWESAHTGMLDAAGAVYTNTESTGPYADIGYRWTQDGAAVPALRPTLQAGPQSAAGGVFFNVPSNVDHQNVIDGQPVAWSLTPALNWHNEAVSHGWASHMSSFWPDTWGVVAPGVWRAALDDYVAAGAGFADHCTSGSSVAGPAGRCLLMPFGAVFARIFDEIAAGRIGFITMGALFADNVHVSALGGMICAWTVWAVAHRRNPVGLPRGIGVFWNGATNEDRAANPVILGLAEAEVAQLQQTVWDVVTEDQRTGVAD